MTKKLWPITASPITATAWPRWRVQEKIDGISVEPGGGPPGDNDCPGWSDWYSIYIAHHASCVVVVVIKCEVGVFTHGRPINSPYGAPNSNLVGFYSVSSRSSSQLSYDTFLATLYFRVWVGLART